MVMACAAGAAETKLPAFPGAEGWGCDTPGGRGGKVMIVTNVNPDGPGSLQEACAAKGPRIVVFEVSGVISNMITIENSNITIAGQTAPGAGITIEGQLVTKEGISDVVIRHLRVRPRTAAETFAGPAGEKRARRLHECGKANPFLSDAQRIFSMAAFRAEPNECHDGAPLNGVSNLVVDHCTFSWGADEVVSVCRSQYVTFQWCTIEEGAIKEGRKYSGYHNFGLFSAYNVEGDFISVHHNLFAHNSRRTPSVRDGFADLRNNVIYNARGGFDHDGGGGNDYNYIGNYFKRGPNSTGVLAGVSWGRSFWWAEFRGPGQGSKYYVEDNLWDNQPPPLPPYVEDGTVRLKEPMPAPKVTTQKATEAYELVLKQAGCFPRDAVSRRTIEEVRNGTGDYGRREPEGGLMEGLTPGQAPKDTDRDGMPDDWEKKNGLDAAKDDSAKVMPGGYTAIEVYINERAEKLLPPGGLIWPPPVIAKALALYKRGDHAAALKQFSQALHDADSLIRREAFSGIATMGTDASPEFDRVIEAIAGEKDHQALAAAASALAGMAGEDQGRLVDLVSKDSRSSVRVGALAALATYKEPAATAVKAATTCLDDNEKAIRRKALTALAVWKKASAPAAGRLAAMLGDKDGETADAACGVLVAIGSDAEPVIPVLIKLFRRSEADYRVRAVAVLTALGAAATPAVAALMEDSDRVLVLRTIALLEALGPAAQAAAPALRRRLQGEHWQAAAGALLAVGAGQEQAVFEAVVPRLSDPDTVAEAAAFMVRMAAGKADAKRRRLIVKALAKELSAQTEKEITPARLAGIRILLRSLGELGAAAASAEATLKKVSGNLDLLPAVREVWSKIMPGKPLRAPVPEMDDIDDL